MPFANCGELRTYYELTGETGPLLVLSNSLGTNLSMWEPQMAAMAPHHRILRYDTRGHGQTSATPGEYTIEQLGRDVLNLLDALNLGRAHFCGLSMGGMIGIWLGAHAPKRLHRLVLSNTAARIGTKETWNNRIATARKDGLGPIAAGVIERWFTPEFRAAHPQRVATTQRMLENSPPEGYASCCAAIRDMDQTEMISKIEGPTLVIYGAKDPVTPPADAHFLTSHIRGAKGVELDAAHLSNVEQAAVFTESLRRFLAE